MTTRRASVDDPRPTASPSDGRPLTRAEAVQILARLNAAGLIKPMRAAPMTTRRDADRRIVARQLAGLILDQVETCEAAERASDAVEACPAMQSSTTTEGTMDEQIGAHAQELTDTPDSDDVALEYLELGRRALNDALRDKTRDVAKISARFERLCADEGKPYDADLTGRAVAAAIAARDRALDAFAARVRATARSASARRAAPAKATPNVAHTTPTDRKGEPT